MKKNEDRGGQRKNFDSSQVKVERRLPENIDQATRVLDVLIASARGSAENVQAYVREFEYRYELSEEDQKSNGKKDRYATKKTQG